MRVDSLEGITRYFFRQSWLGTFQHCPEQARLDIRGELPRRESDATAMGTAMHSGIEEIVTGGSTWSGLDAAIAKFDELSELPEFEWLQVKTKNTAHAYVKNCLGSWYQYTYPQLGTTISVEQDFKVVLDAKPGIELWLTGTWDYEDEGGLWDWKTAGREYERWEVERWYVQPTVYSFGHAAVNDCEPVEFNYSVSVKGAHIRPTQIIPVQRTRAHFEWLKAQCWSIVDLYESTDGGARSWPLMDQGWWCSPKWCTAWASCKGAHL